MGGWRLALRIIPQYLKGGHSRGSKMGVDGEGEWITRSGRSIYENMQTGLYAIRAKYKGNAEV